jgi:hypothetical protein
LVVAEMILDGNLTYIDMLCTNGDVVTKSRRGSAQTHEMCARKIHVFEVHVHEMYAHGVHRGGPSLMALIALGALRKEPQDPQKPR